MRCIKVLILVLSPDSIAAAVRIVAAELVKGQPQGTKINVWLVRAPFGARPWLLILYSPGSRAIPYVELRDRSPSVY